MIGVLALVELAVAGAFLVTTVLLALAYYVALLAEALRQAAALLRHRAAAPVPGARGRRVVLRRRGARAFSKRMRRHDGPPVRLIVFPGGRGRAARRG